MRQKEFMTEMKEGYFAHEQDVVADYMSDLPPAERAEREQAEARKTLRPQSERDRIYGLINAIGGVEELERLASFHEGIERMFEGLSKRKTGRTDKIREQQDAQIDSILKIKTSSWWCPNPNKELNKTAAERERLVAEIEAKKPIFNTYTALEILGDGDASKGEVLLSQIAERLKHARQKHPIYAANTTKAMFVINSEVLEMAVEVFGNNNDERAQDECLDVIATAIRFKNEEWVND